MAKIILITGGTKSGKSDFAEYLAKKNNQITYVALSETRPNDKSWQNRISRHKKKRPKTWKLIETEDLVPVLKNTNEILLVDSIGGFVTNTLQQKEDDWIRSLNELISQLKKYKKQIIIVGEQSGWGLVSQYKIGNKFIDRLGETLKKISKISEENWITINGKAINLDDISIDFSKNDRNNSI